MKVAVIGTGHVGLVTAVAMAAIGHDVVGSDTDEGKISLLQRGIPPYYEPGLEQALEEKMAAGRLSFSSTTEEAVRDAEIVFICVSTPPRPDGEANLLYVEQSAADVARHAPDGAVVVDKSTVPAGTADGWGERCARRASPLGSKSPPILSSFGRGPPSRIRSSPTALSSGSSRRPPRGPSVVCTSLSLRRGAGSSRRTSERPSSPSMPATRSSRSRSRLPTPWRRSASAPGRTSPPWPT